MQFRLRTIVIVAPIIAACVSLLIRHPVLIHATAITILGMGLVGAQIVGMIAGFGAIDYFRNDLKYSDACAAACGFVVTAASGLMFLIAMALLAGILEAALYSFR